MRSFKFFFIMLFIFVLFFPGISCGISILQEKKLAKKFMAMVEKDQLILQDPFANHMVTTIGRHILSFLPPQPFDYSFYIINNDDFNAFASPAANIFIYRGLITSLDSIDELAGVIGHEIAHAASRHVSESIDRSKYISLGSFAGLLAGSLISSKSGSDAGIAVMGSSMAIGQTAMLAFTRENETEADEKGILILKKTCFEPKGLVSSLLKIRAADYMGAEKIPDYVKTHPGTGDRIAHTEAILSGYTPLENKIKCEENFKFSMIKYRLSGLYGDIESTFKQLFAQIKINPLNAGAHYGLGLIYARKFMREKALEHLKKALSIEIFDPMILLETGRVYLLNVEPKKALTALNRIESDPVAGLAAKFYQSRAHLELKNLLKAKNGFNTIISKAPSLYPKA